MDNEIILDEPLVSVCIPTYNRSIKLNRAVAELKICSYKNLEIIISDNASSDNTQNMCLALAKSDNRIKYFRQSENMGPINNYEFARTQATGKYFLWLCDDDGLDFDYIRTCVSELERDPSLLIVSGLGAYHGGDKKPTHYDKVVQPNSINPLRRSIQFLWSVEDSSIFYGVYRLDSVKSCKFPNMFGGDWALVAEVLLRGKTKMIPQILSYRQIGGMSVSHRSTASTIGAPSWQGSFPSIALPLNIAYFISFKSYEYKDKTIYKKIFAYSLILGVISLKFILFNIWVFGSKIPFAKKIYQRLVNKPITSLHPR